MEEEHPDNYFTEDGDLADWVRVKFETQKYLEGVEAAAYLANMYANTTHGNYVAETLFLRSWLQKYFNVRIEHKGTKSYNSFRGAI